MERLVPHPGCPLDTSLDYCGLDLECPDDSWSKSHDSTKNTYACSRLYDDEKSCVDAIKNDLATPDAQNLQYTWCGVQINADNTKQEVHRGMYKCSCLANEVETLSLDFLKTSIQNGLIHYASIYPGKTGSSRMRRAIEYTCPSPTECKLGFDQPLTESTDSSKLSGGAIAGIVLGAAAFVILVVLFIRRGTNQGATREPFI